MQTDMVRYIRYKDSLFPQSIHIGGGGGGGGGEEGKPRGGGLPFFWRGRFFSFF